VIGDRIRVRSRRGGQRLRRAPMEPSPADARHPLVQRLANEGVREPDAFAARRLDQQVALQPLLRDGEERCIPRLRDRRPHRERYLVADDGRDGQRALRLATQPGDAPVDHLPQQPGHGGLLERVERPSRLGAPHRARFFERAEQLADEEGIPLGTGLEIGDEAPGGVVGQAVAPLQERADGGIVEP
jgi:hypothetical protein